jgi:hypothetical protein
VPKCRARLDGGAGGDAGTNGHEGDVHVGRVERPARVERAQRARDVEGDADRRVSGVPRERRQLAAPHRTACGPRSIWYYDSAWGPCSFDNGLPGFLDWYERWLDQNLRPRELARLYG